MGLLKYSQNLQTFEIFTKPANCWYIYNTCKLLKYLQCLQTFDIFTIPLKKSVSQHRVHQWHLPLGKSEILFAKFPEPDTICVGSFANFKIPADLTICVFITQSSSVTSHWNLVCQICWLFSNISSWKADQWYLTWLAKVKSSLQKCRLLSADLPHGNYKCSRPIDENKGLEGPEPANFW